MRKMTGSVVLAMCIFFMTGSLCFAKNVQKTLPGDITLAQAQSILQVALAKAKAINVPMNIALVDAGGNLKAFYRMEDAFIGSIDISIKKAVTARYFNMSTRDLGAAS